MPARRPTAQVRNVAWRATVVLPAALSLVAAGALLTAQSSAAVRAETAAHPATGVRWPQRAPSGATPVAPKVRSVPIAEFSAAKQAVPRAVLGSTALSTGRLVALTDRPALGPFSMVAVTWDAMRDSSGLSVRMRTRFEGAWTGWTELAADTDGPSAADDPQARGGTAPYWVEHATGVEVAVYATGKRPTHLSVQAIDPGSSAYDAKLAAATSSDAGKRASSGKAGSFPRIPDIVTREQWGADESLGDTCWDPKYGTRFDAVIVHHTAGSNDYTKREAASVVRGVLAYHTISRGWCDIGYNFLIDRYGTIYEGRAGGIRQPVRGAHAGDYNVDTTGISLMGNFDIAAPTGPTKRSLVALVAWRLGTAYHGAYGRPFLFDGRFDRISGHRDVMETACPGRYVYDWLPQLRHRVSIRLSGFSSKIETAWDSAGGKRSRLGPVRIGERMQSGGHNTRFAGGRMYKSRHGLYTLYAGPVLHYYVRSGGVVGDLGYPESAVYPTGSNGKTAKFAGGRVYWSSDSNSHSLKHGAILRKYLRVGGADGRLGFPTSSVHPIHGGMRAGFQGGFITYDAATKKATVTTT